jgi:putative endonuclease
LHPKQPIRRSVDAQARGRDWELRAAEHLAREGLKILVQGYRCRTGELDIIASEGPVLVIVEVKARASASKGRAIETVGKHKQRRIVSAARHFLMRNPVWFTRRIRFDVVAIDGIDTANPKIHWLKNAFDAA